MPALFASQDNDTLENLLHSIGDAVCVSDRDMVFLAANQRFAAFYGMKDPSEIIGKNAFDVYPEFRKSVFYEACSQTVRTGSTTSRVGFSRNLNTWVVIRCYQYGENRYAMVVHRLSDDTDKAGYGTQHDTLTSLPNRWAFEKDANQIKGYQQSLTLAMVDIRHFRSLNETLGMAAGDRCLMEVGARLRGVMAAEDRVYRVGDDQFVLATTRGKEVMLKSVDRAREALELPLMLGNKEYMLQFHVGLCSPVLSDTPEDALKKAERALNHAKGHRIIYAEYRPEMGTTTFDPTLTKEIKDALARGELTLYFQPQIDLIDGKVCGAEVLVRWKHPTKGLVLPDLFLPFAEETGLIQDIDRTVMAQAFEHLAALKRDGRSLPLSVNLSAQSICDAGTIDLMRQHLDETGINPEDLCVEITETSLMRDLDTSQIVIESLKKMGFQIAIDDFGSGYSSMAYLVRYPSQFLKIDRIFVQNISVSDAHRVMVRNMIGLAHGLGIGVIAEGVETQEECSMLKGFGCDVVQGFYFSPPLPAEDFREWVAIQGVSSLKSDIF